MKLFGEYLVEKSIITADQLVMALVEQNAKLPSVAQIAFERKLIPSDEILKVFKIQFEKKTGFIEAARELNLWNDQIHQETEKQIGALRVPLGQILVETASIPLESITHALDNFLGDIEKALEEEADSKVSEVSVEIPDVDMPAVDAVSLTEFMTEATPASPSSDSGDYSNYCDILNADRKEILLSSISLMKAGDVSLSPLKTVKDILHLLKGATRFASVQQSESIIATMENIMEMIMGAEIGKISADFIANAGSACEKNVNLLWEMSEKLQRGVSEEEMFKSTEFKHSFETISASLEMIRFDLDLMV
jgi:hypothetical protein